MATVANDLSLPLTKGRARPDAAGRHRRPPAKVVALGALQIYYWDWCEPPP